MNLNRIKKNIQSRKWESKSMKTNIDYIKKQLKQDEAAKILNICSKSVSRINKRAIEKIKKYLKGDY